MIESCCTCATLLDNVPAYSGSGEKPLPEHRQVGCCDRIICGKCIHDNGRFAYYCPYCQVSNVPSSLPQGLKEPPSYTSVASSSKTQDIIDAPPPYTPASSTKAFDVVDEKAALANQGEKTAEDTLHFLNHDHDSIASLSLRYGVPTASLRRKNNITSDHLLTGRRTILIPGEYYKGGVSLSPRPIEGEEEELRKSKIRRFMTSCKVSDYDIALLYLDQAGYDLEAAVGAFVDDERWEQDNAQGRLGKKKATGHDKQRGYFRRR